MNEREERRGEERRTNWPRGSIGSAACTILFGTRIETVSESDVSAAAMDVEERRVESHGRSRRDRSPGTRVARFAIELSPHRRALTS